MDNFNLKKFLGEKSLLKENAPGYSTRKQGEALPTLEGIKAAFEAKNALKEEEEDASGVEAGKTFANMTPAERKEYGNFADHADIGQFATPEEEWSNHDDDYFYNKGIEIVANEYDGDVTAAYNGVVRSRK
jgi:hypothetical protein